MRIGALAKASGLSRDTIRFYERRGLISSQAESGQNSYRNYPEHALDTLSWIGQAQAAGLTLEELTNLMADIDRASEDEAFDGLEFLDRKIAEVEMRLKRSRLFLKTLRQTRSALERAPYQD